MACVFLPAGVCIVLSLALVDRNGCALWIISTMKTLRFGSYFADVFQDTQSKLRYYCLRQPDKLDRIAKYIYKRLAQDVHRRNDSHMYIAIDAINMLLGGYQGHRLVLAQVFLQMVHLLLQTNRADLQILATNTVCHTVLVTFDQFVEFSQIEDEIPNYPKEYNDLIDHFTSMAHASLPDVKERNRFGLDFPALPVFRVRRAGICGIQGVVRKTVGGQLHIDVVHGPNMDKIIPSLLLNICDRAEIDPEDSQEDPSQEAIFVFKDIARRASYHNIEPVVASILIYRLTSISNTMHNILRTSIDKTPQVLDDTSPSDAQVNTEERQFQDAIINTIAEFAKNLPDTQKIEILKFILNFEPMAKTLPSQACFEMTRNYMCFTNAIICRSDQIEAVNTTYERVAKHFHRYQAACYNALTRPESTKSMSSWSQHSWEEVNFSSNSSFGIRP
ncbi:unnamed protein product [Dicrocoelium dendriticum]|nr:unnamed protein product [Dicrocoelium dendriticum]